MHELTRTPTLNTTTLQTTRRGREMSPRRSHATQSTFVVALLLVLATALLTDAQTANITASGAITCGGDVNDAAYAAALGGTLASASVNITLVWYDDAAPQHTNVFSVGEGVRVHVASDTAFQGFHFVSTVAGDINAPLGSWRAENKYEAAAPIGTSAVPLPPHCRDAGVVTSVKADATTARTSVGLSWVAPAALAPGVNAISITGFLYNIDATSGAVTLYSATAMLTAVSVAVVPPTCASHYGDDNENDSIRRCEKPLAASQGYGPRSVESQAVCTLGVTHCTLEDCCERTYGNETHVGKCPGGVSGATAFVTFMCVLCSLHTQISQSICTFTHCRTSI
jgi:hypothetical protein